MPVKYYYSTVKGVLFGGGGSYFIKNGKKFHEQQNGWSGDYPTDLGPDLK